jgi:hypothetical protein
MLHVTAFFSFFPSLFFPFLFWDKKKKKKKKEKKKTKKTPGLLNLFHFISYSPVTFALVLMVQPNEIPKNYTCLIYVQ